MIRSSGDKIVGSGVDILSYHHLSGATILHSAVDVVSSAAVANILPPH